MKEYRNQTLMELSKSLSPERFELIKELLSAVNPYDSRSISELIGGSIFIIEWPSEMAAVPSDLEETLRYSQYEKAWAHITNDGGGDLYFIPNEFLESN